MDPETAILLVTGMNPVRLKKIFQFEFFKGILNDDNKTSRFDYLKLERRERGSASADDMTGGTAVDPMINDLQISQELLDQDLGTIPPSIEGELQKAIDFDDIRHEIELINLSGDSKPIIEPIHPQTLEPVQEERLIGEEREEQSVEKIDQDEVMGMDAIDASLKEIEQMLEVNDILDLTDIKDSGKNERDLAEAEKKQGSQLDEMDKFLELDIHK
jgi:hypothetical protein